MSQGFERATDRKVRSHLKVCRTTVEEYDEQLLTNICQLQVSKDYAAQWETCKAIAIGRIRVEVAKRSISNERHSIFWKIQVAVRCLYLQQRRHPDTCRFSLLCFKLFVDSACYVSNYLWIQFAMFQTIFGHATSIWNGTSFSTMCLGLNKSRRRSDTEMDNTMELK